ncbi:MAG: hypothetical protein ACOCVX_02765 [Bacteroidales bacterium]
MKRLTLLLLLIFTFYAAGMSQVVGGYFDKLADMYENEEWEDCAKRSNKMLNKKKYAGDPELYLYQALAYYQISQDSDLSKLPEYRNAYMEAIKTLTRAVKKDKYGEYFPENNFIITDIIKAGIPMLLDYSANKNFNKINSLLRNYLNLSEDPALVFYQAVMDIMGHNQRDGLETMSAMLPALDSVERNSEAHTKPLLPDGMKHYFDLLIEEYEIDSAKRVIKIAHDEFPGNEAIDKRYQMNLDSLRYD